MKYCKGNLSQINSIKINEKHIYWAYLICAQFIQKYPKKREKLLLLFERLKDEYEAIKSKELLLQKALEVANDNNKVDIQFGLERKEKK